MATKTLLYSRKVKDKGCIKLFARQTGENPASLCMEVYIKATQKRTLQALNLYYRGNEIDDMKVKQAGERHCLEYVFSDGVTNAPRQSAKNFTAFVEEQISKVEKPQSQEYYNSCLKKVKAYAKQEIISFKRIDEAFLKGLKQYLLTEARSRGTDKNLAQKTAHNYFSITKTWANKAKSKGLLSPFAYYEGDIKPIPDVKIPVVTFSIEAILKLQATLYPPMPMLPKAFMLQFASLQRWGDIKQITWEGLDSFINQQKTGKNIVTLFDRNLLSWIADGDKRVGNVFIGFPENDQDIRKHLRAWAKLAGVYKEKIGTHIFRRSGATILFKAGESILKISLALGHATIEQTKAYIGVTDDDIKACLNTLNAEVISKFVYPEIAS